MDRVISCVTAIREELSNAKKNICLDETNKGTQSPFDISQIDEACATESLEDLAQSLRFNIHNSNWLELNTAEKWTKDNPELAQAYFKNINKKE